MGGHYFPRRHLQSPPSNPPGEKTSPPCKLAVARLNANATGVLRAPTQQHSHAPEAKHTNPTTKDTPWTEPSESKRACC